MSSTVSNKSSAVSTPLQQPGWIAETHTDGGSAFAFRLTEAGLLHSEQTDYQKIEIYDTEFYGKLMLIDGFVMLTTRDNFLYHEMMAHPVLFTHPKPRRVIIIGGGDCGTLREVLRHKSVESAVQVEIDERVTRLAEQYFPELCEANDDSRAELLFVDGIKWMEAAPSNSADIIIIDSTDPIGPAEGLFSEPFYRQCGRVLGEEGILIQQSESPLYHPKILSSMRQEFTKAGFTNLQTIFFPQPTYPSGWWSGTMASQADLSNFRTEKDFPTDYYTSNIHRGAVSPPPFFTRMLEDA